MQGGQAAGLCIHILFSAYIHVQHQMLGPTIIQQHQDVGDFNQLHAAAVLCMHACSLNVGTKLFGSVCCHSVAVPAATAVPSLLQLLAYADNGQAAPCCSSFVV